MPKRKKVADPREEEDILSTEQSRIKHTEMLNSSFFRWIQDQYANHRAEFWRNGLEEYLQYGREIQAKFPVTADSQADAPSTSTAGAAQNSKPQQPAAFPAPWPAASSSQPALVNSLTHHHQAAENAAPSTAAPDTSASPKSVHGFNAPTQPAPLSPGGTSSAAPQQSNSFSFPSVPSTNSLSPIPAASQGKQQVSSLSNHHLLPESTQGTDTHSSPPTSISTVATLTPPVDLPAASSTSLSGPSLAVSSMPSTSGSQSTPLGVSQMPIGSPFTFASPTTTADMSSPVATTLAGGMSFTWGPPKISLISGDAGGAAADGNGLGTAAAPFGTASALFGTAAAPPSSGRSSGQNGITTDFGAAAHTNGTQEEDEQAEPEEAVLYEKKEGVLLSLELKWRHNMNGKWAKTRQGKVLVCHPSGAAKPYLQFQTSGQVVATAYVQTPLTQQKDPSQLLGALSVSFRHVDKESEKESYDKPQVLSTLMYCASADAAKQLSDKMPAPKRS
ncbi:hypothetical protein WJX79_010336 [Trebouxia sp. C0005]